MPVAVRSNPAAAPKVSAAPPNSPKLLTVRYELAPKKISWTNPNVKVARQKGELNNSVGGKLTYSNQFLKIGDKKVQLDRSFKQELESFKHTSEPYTASYDTVLTPRGNAGKYVSLTRLTSTYYEGAAHPNHGQEYATLDTTTGKRVKLQSILTPEQHRAVYKSVRQQLKAAANAKGQPYQWDDKELKSFVNNSFSVRNEGGKTILNVGVPSYVHAWSGTMADFRFEIGNVS